MVAFRQHYVVALLCNLNCI